MLKIAGVGPNDYLIDLGPVMAASSSLLPAIRRAGFGVDLNPERIMKATRTRARQG